MSTKPRARAKRRGAAAALAFAAVTSVAAPPAEAQLTTTTSSSTTSLQQPVLITTQMIAAFRAGLTASMLTSQSILKPLGLQWVALAPSGIRYRLLRGPANTGPWVAVGDVDGTTATVTNLPPNTKVYTRVVALRSVNGVWTPTDTTYAVSATTAGNPTQQLDPKNCGSYCYMFFPVTCATKSNLTVALVWPLRAALRFDVTVNKQQPGGPIQIAGPFLSGDTTFFQAAPGTAGTYGYAVTAHYAVRDWPGPGQSLTVPDVTKGGASVTVASGGAPACN